MPALTPERKQRIIDLRREHKSVPQICALLRCSHNTVNKVLPPELRSKKPEPKGISDEERETVLKLRAEHRTIQYIARSIHRNEDVVRTILTEAGIPLRPAPPVPRTKPPVRYPIACEQEDLRTDRAPMRRPKPPKVAALPVRPQIPVTITAYRPMVEHGRMMPDAIRWWNRCEHGAIISCRKCAA